MYEMENNTKYRIIKKVVDGSSGQISEKGNFPSKHGYSGKYNHTKCNVQKISEIIAIITIP